MHKLSLFLLFLCFNFNMRGQTFSYSLSKTSGSYQELSDPKILESSSLWNPDGYLVAYDFDFPVAGKTYRALTVTPNGMFLFGEDNDKAICAFKGIKPVMDSAGNYSSIAWKTSGAEGSRVLKIQYRDCGFGYGKPGLFNLQVWLHENTGKIEFHIGSTDLSTLSDSLIMTVVGVINPRMDGSSNGYLIEGNPSQPISTPLVGNQFNYLIRVPDENTVYTLTVQ